MIRRLDGLCLIVATKEEQNKCEISTNKRVPLFKEDHSVACSMNL